MSARTIYIVGGFVAAGLFVAFATGFLLEPIDIKNRQGEVPGLSSESRTGSPPKRSDLEGLLSGWSGE